MIFELGEDHAHTTTPETLIAVGAAVGL